MSVWMCAPSKRLVAEAQPIIDLWRGRGYLTAIWRDTGDEPVDCDLLMRGEYPGHYDCMNRIMREAFKDLDCNWVVCASDDTEPDMNRTPEVIAWECTRQFGSRHTWWPWPPKDENGNITFPLHRVTFGVMQPTGDRYADGSIDRICGSPWIGREFARRMYGGRGAFFSEYRHMFGDEELQEVAIKLGVLWQRPDLIHLHHHFMRVGDRAFSSTPPPHLREANSREHWDKYKALFLARKAAGFPGHEPIP